MTAQMEKTLNLPSIHDVLGQTTNDSSVEENTENDPENQVAIMAEKLAAMDMSLREDDCGISEHVEEMDKIIEIGLKAHQQTFDLAMNMEPKNSGQVFENSARFLEAALNASKSKSDARMKMAKLGMDRERLDDMIGKNKVDGVIESDNGIQSTRNDVLARIRSNRDKTT